MANPYSINQCLWCQQLYCSECSEASSPFDYCSDECIEKESIQKKEDQALQRRKKRLERKKTKKTSTREKISSRDISS